jgi:hypothetical protein
MFSSIRKWLGYFLLSVSGIALLLVLTVMFMVTALDMMTFQESQQWLWLSVLVFVVAYKGYDFITPEDEKLKP